MLHLFFGQDAKSSLPRRNQWTSSVLSLGETSPPFVLHIDKSSKLYPSLSFCCSVFREKKLDTQPRLYTHTPTHTHTHTHTHLAQNFLLRNHIYFSQHALLIKKMDLQNTHQKNLQFASFDYTFNLFMNLSNSSS